MLDQDAARALLSIADESGARVALMGDRHQLPAVGRGGMLELAHRWVDPDAFVTLDEVHRFTRQAITADETRVRVPDPVYAVLTLQMRHAYDPTRVFDALQARGQVVVHASGYKLQQAIADQVAGEYRAGRTVAVVVDTREQAAAVNAVIRDRLVDAGLVDDRHTTSTHAGESIGAGDLIATRRNAHHLDVANRDAWAVTRVHRDGAITVSGERGRRELPADYVREHVELGYASTAHGAQGDTATTAHLVLGDHTTSASAYVGMTRGRDRNTTHLVAADLDDAREQWVAAFTRDRADLGPTHAAARAARPAAGYGPARPLHEVLSDLRHAWREQADQQRDLQRATAARERLEQVIGLRAQRDQGLAVLDARHQQAQAVAERARAEADRCAAAIEQHAQQIHDRFLAEWERQREQARDAGRAVLAGPGRLGLRLAAVNRANATFAHWSLTWQPYLSDMPTSTSAIARYATWPDRRAALHDAFDQHARGQAEHARPEHRDLRQKAEAAEQRRREISREAFDLRSHYDARLMRYGALAHLDDPEQRLDQLTGEIRSGETRLGATGRRIDRLTHDPAITAQPPGWLERQHESWRADDADETAALHRITELRHALAIDTAARERMHAHDHEHQFQHDTGRHGPDLGR